MGKSEVKTNYGRIKCVVILLLITSLILSACGSTKNTKSNIRNLTGSWYLEGEDTPSFTLYDDGTCSIRGEYGEGTWSIVNDDQLKLTNYYGQIETATIISLQNGCLTLGDGKNRSEFWNTPQTAEHDNGIFKSDEEVEDNVSTSKIEEPADYIESENNNKGTDGSAFYTNDSLNKPYVRIKCYSFGDYDDGFVGFLDGIVDKNMLGEFVGRYMKKYGMEGVKS